MVQLYIKHTDNEYYLLDLEENVGINYKLTVKDLNDITKIFSPYTQSFTLKATAKNKILCGFVGNEKIQRINSTGEFDAMLYISGFIFQSGKLTFEESDYEFQDQKEFKTSFASNLTSLVDKLGDMTIQQLFQDSVGAFDPLVKTVWNRDILKDRMQSVKNITLANGINFKWGVPFISNNRVWTWDDENLATVDNIAYKATKTEADVNFINLQEVRPAVTYMTIMRHLLLKIGTPVTCPLFDKPEVKDLYVWCSSENLISPNEAAFLLINYAALTYLRYDTKDDADGKTLPANPKWIVTGGGASGIFTITRDNTVLYPTKWSDGIDLNIIFTGLVSLESPGTKIKVVVRNTANNVILDTQEITGDTYTYRLLDSQLDTNGQMFVKFEILPVTLVNWTSLAFKSVQSFRYDSKFLGVKLVTRAKFSATAVNSTLATTLGGNELNLISILPKMKAIDFLKSFFRTFNISVISTGLQDQSTYWLTPSDIQEDNKPYSKRIVDNYTDFVDVASLNKKKVSQYNQYSFKHFDSKYYESVFGDGSRFGALEYPTLPPAKPTKFEVKTEYSILKQGTAFVHPSSARTCFGFTNEAPTVLANGGNRYKPVYDEFTLFYLQPKNLELNPLALEYTITANNPLYSVLEASFQNSNNGKTLSFGDGDSLYLNYYRSFIELLLKPNSYLSEFTLNLPPNEIFLNFANLKQGESNIPTGFRPQNEIIISEQRYTLQEASIDLTSGKTKLSLINL